MQELEQLLEALKKSTKAQTPSMKISSQLPLEHIFPDSIQESSLTPTEQKVYLQLALEYHIVLSRAGSYQEGVYRWSLILDDRLQGYGLTRETWDKIAAQGDQDEALLLELNQLIQKISHILY
ncbi:MAG: hypothetical protein ACFFE8_03360 [Candidatus Heimdallarchaeota archaeon]